MLRNITAQTQSGLVMAEKQSNVHQCPPMSNIVLYSASFTASVWLLSKPSKQGVIYDFV